MTTHYAGKLVRITMNLKSLAILILFNSRNTYLFSNTSLHLHAINWGGNEENCVFNNRTLWNSRLVYTSNFNHHHHHYRPEDKRYDERKLVTCIYRNSHDVISLFRGRPANALSSSSWSPLKHFSLQLVTCSLSDAPNPIPTFICLFITVFQFLILKLYKPQNFWNFSQTRIFLTVQHYFRGWNCHRKLKQFG